MEPDEKKNFVVLAHARTADQQKIMEGILERGECPFCPGNLPEGNEIIRKTSYWFLMPNMWPYENTKVHLVAVHITHVERLEDIYPHEWSDLFQMLMWAEQRFDIQSGSIGIRFGDPRINRATVRHLHVHLIVPEITDKNDPKYKPVIFMVA
ncbi:MAG: hypothetical protein AAB394_01650 [Patescibacteria group bacterium]